MDAWTEPSNRHKSHLLNPLMTTKKMSTKRERRRRIPWKIVNKAPTEIGQCRRFPIHAVCAFSIINCQACPPANPATNFLLVVGSFFFKLNRYQKFGVIDAHTHTLPHPLIMVQNLWLCACCHCSVIIENDSSKFTTRRQFTDKGGRRHTDRHAVYQQQHSVWIKKICVLGYNVFNRVREIRVLFFSSFENRDRTDNMP